MTVLNTLPNTGHLDFTKETASRDVDPLFYWVPCAGVRYYTFDYRPALRHMAARWADEAEATHPAVPVTAGTPPNE